MIRNNKRLGFGASLYEGFKEGKNPWVIFLHSDCKIDRPSWIIDLFESYHNLIGKNVAMVAPRTNNSGISDPLLESNGTDATEDTVMKQGFLSLYCTLCRRDLFKHIGGFIKPYPYRGYEDEELAIRMRRYGLFQGISGRSWIYHEGSATTKKIRNYAEILEGNRNLCLQDLNG
jgi:GT2 family glycosyltransferase